MSAYRDVLAFWYPITLISTFWFGWRVFIYGRS